jgi:hypothetical protein
MIHMQLVHGTYGGYTKQEIMQAKQARKVQTLIGNPSKKDFRGMVSNHLVANCPVTHTNITNTCQIFGPHLASIRGKPVSWTPEPVVADYVAVPRTLMDRIRIVMLAADIFFVDGTAFPTTLSQKIKFLMAKHVPVQTATSLVKHLN